MSSFCCVIVTIMGRRRRLQVAENGIRNYFKQKKDYLAELELIVFDLRRPMLLLLTANRRFCPKLKQNSLAFRVVSVGNGDVR